MTEKAESLEQAARKFLIQGGGGFEDGEDGIHACTMSAESAIELMADFAAERERQVWAEAAKIAKSSDAGMNDEWDGCADYIAKNLRARGEQVK